MIEASSPLAALQPSSFMGHYGGFHQDPSTFLSIPQSKPFGSNTFNFRDLSMKRAMRHSNQDYFNMQPMRGSSPTASLAADLSQNFHIAQSPQLPTPRRSLFSNNVCTTNNGRCSLTTPPILTSSPGHELMDMDVSPLPHKAPYGSIELRVQSPTPDLTPHESSILSDISPPLSEICTQPMQLTLPQEKKKPGPLRPSLARFKVHSDNSIPRKVSSDNQLPAFKFGNYSSKPAASSSLSLSEIFQESPTQDKSTCRLSNPIVALPRPRPLSGLSTNSSRTGSPIGGQHIRKSSNPLIRPRKQFRRSLSMFEHPEDVINQEKAASPTLLPSIMDIEPHHVPQLPHFISDDQAADLPRITKSTMVDVLDGKYNHLYEKLVIIDCRFEYEYLGGHISGAVNFNDKEKLSSQLFDVEPTSKALLVFHCEYSAHRAPLMAKFIRNKDRAVNAERYPCLTYPEAYILDGGYSSFFKDHSSRCFPQNYVEMDAVEHSHACERGLGKVKQRTKLIRAQTFAFGDRSPGLDSSPTAMGRGRVDTDTEMDLSFEYTPVANHRPALDTFRGRGQRMLSY